MSQKGSNFEHPGQEGTAWKGTGKHHNSLRHVAIIFEARHSPPHMARFARIGLQIRANQALANRFRAPELIQNPFFANRASGG